MPLSSLTANDLINFCTKTPANIASTLTNSPIIYGVVSFGISMTAGTLVGYKVFNNNGIVPSVLTGIFVGTNDACRAQPFISNHQ